MLRYSTIVVTITSDAEPVQGAELVLKWSDFPWSRPYKFARTDRAGKAIIKVPQGKFDIAAYSPEATNISFVYGVATVSSKVTRVDINLTPVSKLKVQVVDLAGNPISYASVRVKPSNKPWNESFLSMTSVNRTAEFYLPAGTYDVRALGILYEYESFSASQQQVTLAEGSSTLVQLQLKPVNVTLPIRPNLVITKQLDKSEALYKDTVAVTVTIENAGDAQALRVNSLEQIPQGFIVSGQTSWSGNLDVNATASYSYAIKVPEPNESMTHQLLTSADYYDSLNNAYRTEAYAYLSVLPNRAPKVTLLSPNGGEYWSGVKTISWAGEDPDADEVSYALYYSLNNGSFVQLASGVTGESYEWNTSKNLDGVYLIKITAGDGKLMGEDTSDGYFRLDNTPPAIILEYPEKIADYMQFTVKANITDVSLKSVTLLLNSTPINYSVSGSAYTSECLGPFAEGTLLNFTIIAEDKVGNVAKKEFNLAVVEGEVKIEGEGKLKEENRTVKIELSAKWKKSEAKGELQLREKDKEEKEKFKAHGKIDKLYRDCSGVFRISGVAKVEVKDDKDKFKEKNVSFTGSVTENEIRITIDGREFIVPAKVKVYIS